MVDPKTVVNVDEEIRQRVREAERERCASVLDEYVSRLKGTPAVQLSKISELAAKIRKG